MKELLKRTLPFWDDLTKREQDALAQRVVESTYEKKAQSFIMEDGNVPVCRSSNPVRPESM